MFQPFCCQKNTQHATINNGTHLYFSSNSAGYAKADFKLTAGCSGWYTVFKHDAEAQQYCAMSFQPKPKQNAARPRHTRVFYLGDTPEQIQRWPPDRPEELRLQRWRDRLDASIEPEPLPSCVNPYAPTHFGPRPDLVWYPPPPPPESEEPRYPKLRATQNEEVPYSLRELHATFPAPFGGAEWTDMVNWRRREGEGNRLAPGEYEHLMRYLQWAEEHDAHLRGRGRNDYLDWLPTPEQERQAAAEVYWRTMARLQVVTDETKEKWQPMNEREAMVYEVVRRQQEAKQEHVWRKEEKRLGRPLTEKEIQLHTLRF